jgi:hypothetical protein
MLKRAKAILTPGALELGLDLQHLAAEILGNLVDAAALHKEQLQVCRVVI